MFDRFHGGHRQEVDVGDQRLSEARGAELLVDLLERRGRRLVGSRHADNLATRFSEADALTQRRRHVLGVGRRHRL